jgi:hypothetical protein
MKEKSSREPFVNFAESCGEHVLRWLITCGCKLQSSATTIVFVLIVYDKVGPVCGHCVTFHALKGKFYTSLTRTGLPHKPNFFFSSDEPIWLAHHQKKLKLRRLPKIEESMERWSASPFWPNYIGEKGRTLGKTYEITARCYWEHHWGTHWEPPTHLCKT